MFNPFARRKPTPAADPSLDSYVKSRLLTRTVYNAPLVGSGTPMLIAVLGPLGCGAGAVLRELRDACANVPNTQTSAMVSSPPPSAGLTERSPEEDWQSAGMHLWFDFVMGRPFPLRLATMEGPLWNGTLDLLRHAHALVLIADSRASRAEADLACVADVRAALADDGLDFTKLPFVFARTYDRDDTALPPAELAQMLGIDAPCVPLSYPARGVGPTLDVLKMIVRVAPKRSDVR